MASANRQEQKGGKRMLIAAGTKEWKADADSGGNQKGGKRQAAGPKGWKADADSGRNKGSASAKRRDQKGGNAKRQEQKGRKRM